MHAFRLPKTKMLSSITQKNVKFAVDSFKPEEYSIDWHGIDPGAGKIFIQNFLINALYANNQTLLRQLRIKRILQ